MIRDRHQHQLGDALTTMFNRRVFSRRLLLAGTTASCATAGLGTLDNTFTTFDSKKSQTTNDGCDGEVLGQGPFPYRAHGHWGVLDRTHYPVKDCHGITEDRNGRIVLLTNNTHNNLVAYDKSGRFLLAWETSLGPFSFDECSRERVYCAYASPHIRRASHPLRLSTKRPGFINGQ